MLNTEGFDRLVLHAAALLCFIAPCAAGREVKTDRVCLRREDIFDLSVCQYVDGNQGCVFSRVFLHRASNDLSTCWAFQNDFYFDLHQQGMEWSRLGLPPSEPLWTHQSRAPVQRWDATTLIYYSEVIHRLWIKRQLNYVVGAAKAGPQQFGTDDLREPRWRDNWDRLTERPKCLIPLIAPGDFLFLWSALCGDEKQISERCLQSRPLIFAEISPKSSRSKVRAELPEDNCAQVCSSSFSKNETDTVWKMQKFVQQLTQKSLFSIQNSHSERITILYSSYTSCRMWRVLTRVVYVHILHAQLETKTSNPSNVGTRGSEKKRPKFKKTKMYPCAWCIIQTDFSDFPTTENINQKFYRTKKKN